ncbi:MAG: site-2 protease family protein [Gammaproteobacteria bacterium]
MVPGSFNLLQTILLYAIPLLFAITMHEVAHGWVAYAFGDPTAKMLGRLSLNPIRHIDPIGTILVPALMVYFSGFIFGWAKPVPVNWSNLHHQRRDVALVALAGPGANFLMAIIWALIAKLALVFGGDHSRITQVLVTMSGIGIQVNIILMVLNLIPIPPLDGSRVISSFLPGRWAYELQKVEQFGFIILAVLLVTRVLNTIMLPCVNFMNHLILGMVGLT